MPIFEWSMVCRGYKNGHQKDMLVQEIGLCAQNHTNYFRLKNQDD